VDLGCRGDLFHRRIFPRSTENRKGFASTHDIDPSACLATFGVTETLRR
jgi:hypothetical protein